MKIPKAADFTEPAEVLLGQGYCLLPEVLSAADCETFTAQYDREQLYRSTINMARHAGRSPKRPRASGGMPPA